MERNDVLVIGGGISGASFAYHAARAGRQVLVVEKDAQPGGCLQSRRCASGFWYELGGHTCYNSYGALLEVLEGCGRLGELQPRGKSVLRFLDDERVVPGKNLGLLLGLFGKLELLRALPRWIGARQDGQTVRDYYGRLVGARNYERVLGPMLSAVPSQTADDFPADMLFKKRERRRDVVRSFTLPGGLRTAVEAILAQPGIEVATGREATTLERSGDGFEVLLDDGAHERAEIVALAVPPGAAARLAAGVAPELARVIGRIREVRVDSLGFAVPSEQVKLPYATFFIPLRDSFHSVVTRDVVPDPERRGFALHFRPGLEREQRLARAAAVLGVAPADMEDVSERATILPSPVIGHRDGVAEVDRLLAGQPLALTGNWFAGLAIEDCVLRSRSEWRRVESR
jgi:UDP-galactopyranose mutase